MADINLIRDTQAGEQKKQELQRQKHAVPGAPALLYPAAATGAQTPGVGTAPSFLQKMRSLFKVPAPSATPQARIIHAERLPTPPRVPVRKGPPILPPASAPRAPASPSTPPFAATPALPPRKTAGAASTPSGTASGMEGGRSFGVNLVPEDLAAGTNSHNRLLLLVGFAITAVLLVGIGYVGLTLFENSVKKDAENNNRAIAVIDLELDDLNDTKQEALAFHTTTLQALQLLNRHVYWTKFLSGLETFTVDTVYYRSMSADQAGRVTLSATAKDLRSVARQLLAFREAKDFVKIVAITAAAARQERENTEWDFTITLTLVDDVFFRTADGSATYPLTTPQL